MLLLQCTSPCCDCAVQHSSCQPYCTKSLRTRPLSHSAVSIPTPTPSSPQHVPRCCSPIDDYRFPLMRHWSLFEAMLHSPYVAVRLQTWHDKGRRLLQDMLVKMGFPAPQFRQKWSEYLTPASYSDLYSYFCTHAGADGLPCTTILPGME